MEDSKKEFLNLMLKELLKAVWYILIIKAMCFTLKAFGVDEKIAFNISIILMMIVIAIVIVSKKNNDNDSDGIIEIEEEEEEKAMIKNKTLQKAYR